MGKITLIIGCMFSGKSSEIIRFYKRYKSIGKKILLINHIDDTRYGKNIVSSHDEIKVDCQTESQLTHLINTKLFNESDIIMIEEGQFFPDLFKFVTTSVDKYNKNIVVAGLDGDYKKEPFGDIIKLIPHSEEIIKLNALCKICNDGTYGYFTKRIVKCDKQYLVGGTNCYIPVCRKHFLT